MLYQSQQMTLKSVMMIVQGKVNDVCVCERVDAQDSYYLMLVIHDHHTANKFLKMIEKKPNGRESYVDVFSQGKDFCVVFDYVKERRLVDFLDASPLSVEFFHTICTNLVTRCMESSLPYSVLYLILEQKQIHLDEDGQVTLSPAIDLTELDEECDEKKCLVLLSGLCRDILHKVNTRDNISYQLLMKKIPKQRYVSFHELYRDLCLSRREKRANIFWRLWEWAKAHRRQLLKAVTILAIVLIATAMFVMICVAIWGEVPLLRIFTNSFTKIGNESLI